MTTAPLHSLGGVDFRWGVASAGHQVEGGNDNADIWFLEQQEPSVFREPSGAAIDSWHRWPDDVALTPIVAYNQFAAPHWLRLAADDDFVGVENYEWICGFEGQLGLHTVDRTTFDRTPKPNAAVYRQLIAASRV